MKRLVFLLLSFASLSLYGQGIIGHTGPPGERIPAVDDVTNAQITVDFEHHEVHEGDHFTFTEFDIDLDLADSMAYIITTPNTTKWAHIEFIVDGQLQTEVSLFETTTHNTGAIQARYNNNRNVSDTATTTIHLSAGGGNDGTEIFKDHFGIDTGFGANAITGGGMSRGAQEWVLKQNTKYLFLVTSFTADNIVSIKLIWYEHSNKN